MEFLSNLKIVIIIIYHLDIINHLLGQQDMHLLHHIKDMKLEERMI